MTTRPDINGPQPISGRCPDVAGAADREGQPMHKHTTHHADHGAVAPIEPHAVPSTTTDPTQLTPAGRCDASSSCSCCSASRS